jgi:hypothetical protein
MTKKILAIIINVSFALCICVSMSGCGDTPKDTVQKKKIVVYSPSVSDILDEKTAETPPVESFTEAVLKDDQERTSTDEPLESYDAENLSTISSSEGSNVDLTALSATAVYGEVYNMMYYPEKYIGKIVTMEGLYSDYLDEATGNHYYACIIMDATACCAQGIEFILTDDYKYPDDYPKEGDNITVKGIFDTYEEEGGMYCTLKEATLLKH